MRFSDAKKNRNGHGQRRTQLRIVRDNETRVSRHLFATPDDKIGDALEASLITYKEHGEFPRCANASCTFRVPEPGTLCPRCVLSGEWLVVNRLLNRDSSYSGDAA